MIIEKTISSVTTHIDILIFKFRGSRSEYKNTWNTWDVRCLNAVMKLPDLAEIRVGIYDDKEKYYQDEFLWRSAEKELMGER